MEYFQELFYSLFQKPDYRLPPMQAVLMYFEKTALVHFPATQYRWLADPEHRVLPFAEAISFFLQGLLCQWE